MSFGFVLVRVRVRVSVQGNLFLFSVLISERQGYELVDTLFLLLFNNPMSELELEDKHLEFVMQGKGCKWWKEERGLKLKTS